MHRSCAFLVLPRLAIALTVTFAVCGSAAQTLPPGTPPPLLAALSEISRAEAAGDLDRALPAYERAAAEITASLLRQGVTTEQAAPLLSDFHARWGASLLRAGRVQEAVRELEEAVHLLPAAEQAPSFRMAMRNARVVHLAAEMARAMNAGSLLVGGANAPQVERLLAPRVPRTADPAVNLMQAHARLHESASVNRVWTEGASSRLAQREAGADLAHDAAALFEAEVDLLHASLALRAAGEQALAAQALSRALAANANRLRALDREVVHPGHAQLFQQRRLLVSALLSLSFEHAASAPPDELIAEIAAAKGLQHRFVQRRRQLLADLQTPRAFQDRSRIAVLERELRSLPTEGEVGVRAWADWQNRYAWAWQPLAQDLTRAGLADFWQPGDRLLAAARERLANEAWIGITSYSPIDPLTLEVLPRRYARYTVTRKGTTLRDIGDRFELDVLLSTWRMEIAQEALGPAQAGLSRRLLANLPEDVLGATRWIVEGDGLLALAPFEALQDPAGGLVVSRRSVRYASSLAQFVQAADHALKPSAVGVVIADPEYESGRGAIAATDLRDAQGSRAAERALAELPDTAAEAAAVGEALGAMGVRAVLRLRKDATPAALSSVQSPRFLHVASHGLLLAPPLAAGGATSVGVLVPELLSALVLADPGGSTGTFWAQDALTLNLRGTELVVLSACDTGNGTVDVSDSLTGLRSAFEQAGARATLTSLWPVRSGPTKDLMANFYRALAEGQGHADALQRAKLRLIAAGASPREWAAFVLNGEDR